MELEALLQTRQHPGPPSPLGKETEIPGLSGGLNSPEQEAFQPKPFDDSMKTWWVELEAEAVVHSHSSLLSESCKPSPFTRTTGDGIVPLDV